MLVHENNNKISARNCPLGSLSIITRKLSKLFRIHFNKLDVTNSQAQIFLLLNENEEMTQIEISKILELDRSTISRDLVRLIENDYLYKAKSSRSPLIGLTKKGREFATTVAKEWGKGYKESLELLGEKGVLALKELEFQLGFESK